MFQQTFPIPDWGLLFQQGLPWFLPMFAGFFLIIVPFFWKSRAHAGSFLVAFMTVLVSLFLSGSLWLKAQGHEIGFFMFDRLTYFFMIFFLLSALLTILLSYPYLRKLRLFQPEFYALILFSVFGMGCMVAGSDLMMVFLGLEVMSISLYVLTGFWRTRQVCVEAALKYFLLGAFASGFLLLGIAFLYGAAGTTHLIKIYEQGFSLFQGPYALYVYLAWVFLAIGFAFKIALVPFHFWAPDVYEGAPIVVTAFMSTAVKAAAFGALLRVAWAFYQWDSETWASMIWVGSVITMSVANIAALVQSDLKRMLAYSSIAHAGYILIPFVAFGWQGIHVSSSVSFYLMAYILTTMGAFAVISALTGENQERSDIRFLSGMGKTQPFLGFTMTFFMLSLAGIPPTVGFFGKYYLFNQVIQAGFVWLVVIAVLNSVISVYYYLRPVMVMYFGSEKEEGLPPFPVSRAVLAVVVLCLLGVICFGLFPNSLLQLVQETKTATFH